MLENRISSINVVDNNDDRLKDIVTKSDMVDAYAKYYPIKSLAEEYMTKKVITVALDENLHVILKPQDRNNTASRNRSCFKAYLLWPRQLNQFRIDLLTPHVDCDSPPLHRLVYLRYQC